MTCRTLHRALGLACLFLATPAWAETIKLVTGQQKVISAPGVSRIAIGKPSVADVRVLGSSQVLVTALGAGTTELTVWRGPRTKNYTIVVTSMDPRKLRAEVEKLLGNREGISVRTSRDTIYIEGSVLTLPDLEKAEEVASLFAQVRNLVKLHPSAHRHIAQAINKQLKRNGLKYARAAVVGSTVFLEGTVDNDAQLKKAEIITKSIGPNIQIALTVAASQMVELQVEFVEISKNSLDRIGVRWPTDLSGNLNLEYNRVNVLKGQTLADQEVFTGVASVNASLGLALQFNDGITRVLAKPRLVTTSRQEAKYLVGGEVPIPIVTQNTSSVQYKEYGVRLKITPTVEGDGSIRTKILTEISDVDQSVAVQGIPGFLTRRVDTEVTVSDGQPIVLSGLVQSIEGKDVTKVPVLGHLPILGELFKSRQFQNRQTELVVFVTPRLIDPLSDRLAELVADMRVKYDRAGEDLEFGLFD